MLDPVTERLLLENAREALAHAYLVQSPCGVGAAALTASGKVIRGCTIDNSNPAQSQCAEKVTIFKLLSDAKTKDDRKLVALALFANGPEPVIPCGACRNAIAEVGPHALVLSACTEAKTVRQWSIDALWAEA